MENSSVPEKPVTSVVSASANRAGMTWLLSSGKYPTTAASIISTMPSTGTAEVSAHVVISRCDSGDRRE